MNRRLELMLSLYAFATAIALPAAGVALWHWSVEACVLVGAACAAAGALYFPRNPRKLAA